MVERKLLIPMSVAKNEIYRYYVYPIGELPSFSLLHINVEFLSFILKLAIKKEKCGNLSR
jgi:hypothetical protein